MIRYEGSTRRVKSIAFHPKLPWVLFGIFSGQIQVHDFAAKQLLFVLEEHTGPVRGLCIHSTQSLCASGGDDAMIKIWNLNERRCLYSIKEHTDYIRSLMFHHMLPWILSACDDYTTRIFNWQNRQCIAIIHGHTHYVMCAKFHPIDDLIVTASLDETVCIWDYSGLKKKLSTYTKSSLPPTKINHAGDIVLKATFDEHTNALNWADFHPTKNLIVSSADDKSVRVSRYNESSIWEISNLMDFTHNVVCCMFHPRSDLVVACSEDATIKIWDYTSRTVIQTINQGKDRVWIVSCHPTLHYFAAGHDSGFILFKIESRKPPFIRTAANTIFKISNNELQIYDFFIKILIYFTITIILLIIII